MTEEYSKKVFEQYNPTSGVVRCPNGRASIRKQLDSYAKAAVNLYGIISCNELIDIFNKQNFDQTSSDELYILLLPLVLKDGWYCFYKEYIVHYLFFSNFEHVDFLLKHQADKPRYIPEKDELLKYVYEDYEDNEHWWHVRRFMWNIFGYSKVTSESYEEVRNYMTYGDGISELGHIFERRNLIFNGEEELQEFIELIMLAKNNTRIWRNNGHTPSELHEINSKRDRNVVQFPKFQRQVVGRNDPCPCGSGKKYKKCCSRFDEEKTAQLSSEELRLFYETWFGLMSFVNERKNVIRVKIKPEYPNAVTDIMIHKVREVLWESPDLINEYINETQLSQEKVEILRLWRKNHKKGMFFILEYQPEYAIAIALSEQGKDMLYGIKGISDSVASTLQRNLPVQIETVLLPFKGKIIYDSFMSTIPIGYSDSVKASFRAIYDDTIKHGIITHLE